MQIIHIPKTGDFGTLKSSYITGFSDQKNLLYKSIPS